MGSSIGSASITPTSPIRTSSARLVAVLGADVDVQVLDARAPSRGPSPLSRWIGLRPITPGTSPSRVVEPDALADEHDRVPAADLAEAQEAVVVDVGDVDADLVDVADDGQRRAVGGAGDPGQRGADVVAADLGGEGGAAVAPDPGRARSRGRRGRPPSAALSSSSGAACARADEVATRASSRTDASSSASSSRSTYWQDAAVAVVLLLLGGVDPHRDLELLVVGLDRQRRAAPRRRRRSRRS